MMLLIDCDIVGEDIVGEYIYVIDCDIVGECIYAR